jgi:hypothetical protein
MFTDDLDVSILPKLAGHLLTSADLLLHFGRIYNRASLPA